MPVTYRSPCEACLSLPSDGTGTVTHTPLRCPVRWDSSWIEARGAEVDSVFNPFELVLCRDHQCRPNTWDAAVAKV